MIREVCLYDKFSYCKNGVRCLRIHLKEVCWNGECRDYRKCNKRHPKPCKSFMEKGFCRFGTSCRYSHRPPKVIEEQNKKIESLENNTAKLLKQVADQDDMIKDLKKELYERECKEMKSLQGQIDDLVEKNMEKERAIKIPQNDFNFIRFPDHNLSIDAIEDEEEEAVLTEAVVNDKNDEKEKQGDKKEKQGGTIEEVIVSQERCMAETIKKATITYAHMWLNQVEKLEAEIRKIKKNDKDLGTTLRMKCNDFCNRLDKIEVNEELCEDVIEKIVNLREFLSFAERKPNIERNLRSIVNCKKYLRGYIYYPKRPSQISLSSCCNKCALSS